MVTEQIFILIKYLSPPFAKYPPVSKWHTPYLCQVANSFSAEVFFDKKKVLAVIVPQLHKDGMYYEINIKGYPRFFMKWSELGRFDIVDGKEYKLPYQLILAVSDVIEKKAR